LTNEDWRGGVVTLGAAFFSLFVMLFFLSSEKLQIPQTKLIFQLNQKVYGIYLMHPIMLMLAAKSVYHVLPGILGIQILFQPILYIAGILIPWFFMEFIAKKGLRKFYVYLFG
jgi:peptidoglycan/LPS O-acetylase OafA/YrhL